MPSRDLMTLRAHARRMAESTPSTRITAEWEPGRLSSRAVGEMSDEDRAKWRMLAEDTGDPVNVEPEPVPEPDLDREPTPDDVPLLGEPG